MTGDFEMRRFQPTGWLRRSHRNPLKTEQKAGIRTLLADRRAAVSLFLNGRFMGRGFGRRVPLFAKFGLEGFQWQIASFAEQSN